MTSNKELERFAEQLMRLVRDRAISECDRLAAGAVAGPDGERWRSLLTSEEARRAVDGLIPDIVDQALFELLNALDNGELPLAWRSIEGDALGLDQLGRREMAGWLIGSPGWRHEHSSQRFHDPQAHLLLEIPEDDWPIVMS
jgi:hypothetical protein